MTEPNSSFPHACMFKDVSPELFGDLVSALKKENNPELIDQLTKLSIPAQKLAGNPDDFSFMAYPIPRLSQDKRQQLTFQEHDDIKINMDKGEIRIEFDGFGQINWLHVSGLPKLYFDVETSLLAT